MDDLDLENELAFMEVDRKRNKLANLDQYTPGWRDMRHENGAPRFSLDGTMLDPNGNRSIFDDVDE